MAAPQQPNQSDNSASMLWGTAAAFAAIYAIWYVFQTQIVVGFLTLKLYELELIQHFYSGNFDQLRQATLSAIANPKKVDFSVLIAIGKGVGDWYRIPLMGLMFVLAIVVYLTNSVRMFKRNYSMNDLAHLEKVNWPQISPVLDKNLLKTDIDVGPWAMAMTPMQFCKRYRLLEEVRPQRREGMSRKEWDRVDVILKKGEANKLFAMQLGQLWKGSKNLPPYMRALYAVFAARINADSKSAAQLILQINASVGGTLNFSGADELIKKHEPTKLVQQIIHSHAYLLTVMASMLEGARSDGVQASADFLWLKPIDRRLWYILNSVGRQTPFVEVGGIFAHWIAEKQAGRKLLIPMIDEATKALEIALKEVIYKPDEK